MGAEARRCCGIDVHKKSVMVHVLPPESDRKGKAQEREFLTFSRDLRSLRTWLKKQHVTEVVMESTGQYWRPLWNILEGEVARLVLVNPAHVKALAGRKTDRIDSQRLARYLENRDLDGSFVPGREIRELRDLTRSRVHLLQGGESREEPHYAAVRSGQHQSVECSQRLVWRFRTQDAGGGGRRAARSRLDGGLRSRNFAQ